MFVSLRETLSVIKYTGSLFPVPTLVSLGICLFSLLPDSFLPILAFKYRSENFQTKRKKQY